MTTKSGNCTGNFLLGRVPPGVKAKDFFRHYVLTLSDEATLYASAREDARRYVYNAIVSFLGGVASLHSQQAAWAVTKMYYAVFYISRAALCRSRHVIFHVLKEAGNGHTQYEFHVVVGNRAVIVDKPPSTHKLVATRFQEMGYPVFMRGLRIEGADPIMWLMQQREYWQYRAGRFPDPDLPDIFDKIEPDKIQRYLAEYETDARGIYLSDPAHAIISVPFRLLTWALADESLLSTGVVDAEDIRYLRKRCCIGKQKLTSIDQYLQ